MTVPLLDLKAQYATIKDDVARAIASVVERQEFVMGREDGELETAVAALSHAKHVIGCASGTDAILLPLKALGLKPGDEVIAPSFTFFATAGTIHNAGGRPVFVDIDPVTYNIDAAKIDAAVTSRSKAIIPVHLYGQCAAMAPLMGVARKHKLVVIEDACQAIGAEYAGKRAGSIGDMGCFSFYPTKNLGGIGDGGLMTCHSDEYANKLRILRVHGERQRYHHQLVGFNSRLDSLQAAALNVKLPHLDRWTSMRATNAARYHELFAQAGLDHVIQLPIEAADCRHVWNQYVVRIPDGKRDALREHMTARKIGTQIYYPVPLHLQECFASLGIGEGALPETERAAKETIALPIFPELTADEQRAVVTSIADFFGVAGTGKLAPPRPKFLDAPVPANRSNPSKS